jgi:hypothetical protein
LTRRVLETWGSWIAAAVLFGLSLSIYASRMAPSVVPGDPGEYQLIAARWGIGHPPGYGFYALVANLFTRLVPIHTFAWRANLLSAVCGAAIVAMAYGIGRTLSGLPSCSLLGQAPPLLGALTLAAGLDMWQHAIHANAHMVTATLATFSVTCLLLWWRSNLAGSAGSDRWLFLFCLAAGVSPVHHPLLVFAFPAYAMFILVVRPRILRDWRTLLKMAGLALLGLAVFLYYPIRSAIGAPPLPGPSTMHTWDGFVGVVTARGLRVNLGGFSLVDVLRRLWDVRVPLRLQYAPPALALAGAGFVGLWARRWRPALLLTGYLACVVFVTVNVLQDAMAYLLGPVVVVGILIGLGVDLLARALLEWTGERWVPVALVVLLSAMPLWAVSTNWARMDLSGFRDADEWLQGIEDRFGGQGQRATILTEWERMTTVYYYSAVEKRTWDAKDVRFVHVSAGAQTPFLDAANENLPLGPVYLTTYRPAVADRYRLMPSGELWQVLPSWPRELPDEAHPVDITAEDRFEVVGWRLSQDRVQPGDVLYLDLYMRMADPNVGDVVPYLPWAKLGDTSYRFTTDKRFLTPWWQPGEIVVERFELPVAWTAAEGRHTLQIGVQLGNRDLQLSGGGTFVPLTEVTVEPAQWRPSERDLEGALGNLRGELLLLGARVNGRQVPGDHDLTVRPGRTLHVVIEWKSLRPIEENYKVFVQVWDAGFQVRAQGDDKAPLRGSAPTLLWFPRWRRGTRLTDTYELELPPDLPPGQYPLVAGMYGFSTFKRAQTVSPEGDMEGDWVTLAHLLVE